MDVIETKLLDTPVSADSRVLCAVDFEAPNMPSAISVIRARVLDFAEALPFTQNELDDIRLAVGEACTNAIKYAQNPFRASIAVSMKRTVDTLYVFISDSGPGFDPDNICPPRKGDLRECGRGIMCMRALMDKVAFHQLHPGTRVELVKRISTPQTQ